MAQLRLSSGTHWSVRVNATEAAHLSAKKIEQKFQNSMSGIIVIDANGNVGAAQTAPKMALGWLSNDGKIQTATHAKEMQT